MTPNEYQTLAMRTEADQDKIFRRKVTLGVMASRFDNAVTGFTDDAGEINDIKKRWLEYGQPLDVNHLVEEIGDCMWRLAQMCATVGVTLEQVMEANIEKLRIRYPDKFTDELAAESNRDRAKEREVIKDVLEQQQLPKCAFIGCTHVGTIHLDRENLFVCSKHLFFDVTPRLIEEHEVTNGPQIRLDQEPCTDGTEATLDGREGKYGLSKPLNHSYNRRCVLCGTPVHHMSTNQICPNCWAKHPDNVNVKRSLARAELCQVSGCTKPATQHIATDGGIYHFCDNHLTNHPLNQSLEQNLHGWAEPCDDVE